VAYKIRFTDWHGAASHIKLMTRRILPPRRRATRCSRVHTLIIDEAHERSLTSTSCSATEHAAGPRRPDLKVS